MNGHFDMKLLSLLDLPDPVVDVLQQRVELTFGTLECAAGISPGALLCSIGNCLDAATIRGLPSSVKAIATYSVGYEHIDLSAASDRGIAVFNTPGVLSDAVADAAMLLILGAARRVTESVSLLRDGRWQGWSPTQLLGVGLGGKTLGILGMGDIGSRVAARGRAFGMKIAYHNRHHSVVEAQYFDDPRALLRESDVLVLSWPSTAQTRGFICAKTLALAKRELILVNIGRGDLIRDADLISALRTGGIRAAGLDVFDGEPRIHPDYLDLPNAFLLPHIGSSTIEARVAMAEILVDALELHMRGGTPPNRLA
jgi:glyoxylate reductase